jgi:uncharacterized protein (DUF302 family)
MRPRFAPAGTAALAFAFVLALALPGLARAETAPAGDGIVKVKSAYPLAETVSRIEADIAAKGIMFFAAIDQQKLAADAKISLKPSTLLIFGNPALGAQFMTSKPESGIDWPVRLLVIEDDKGQVWTVYSDFAWIAQRHQIRDRDAAFTMASQVIASITASVAAK